MPLRKLSQLNDSLAPKIDLNSINRIAFELLEFNINNKEYPKNNWFISI